MHPSLSRTLLHSFLHMALTSTNQAPTDVARNLQKADSDIEAMFDRVAPRYDFLNRVLSGSLDVAWRRRLVELAAVGETGQVLDCATGTGDVLFEFMRQTAYTLRGVGIDFSAAMLDRATQKAGQLGYTDRTEFVKANLLELPFADNTFEAVSVAFGIRNVSDTARGVAEMARVCRPGGHVCILEFMRQPRTFRRRCTDLYTHHILPVIARLVAPDAGAYRYLSASVESFLSPQELGQLMEQAGLVELQIEDQFLGVATLHVGRKPDAHYVPPAVSEAMLS